MERTTSAEGVIPLKSISWVWKYFVISSDDASIAICSQCKLKISRGSKEKTCKFFTTSNMMRHINTKHKDIANKECELKKEIKRKTMEKTQFLVRKKIKSKEVSGLAHSQTTLFETFERKKLWDINDPRSKAIHNYIAEMIAIDIQPFSMTEDLGFKRLLNHISPNYCIPSRKYVKESVFQNIYDKVKLNVQSGLNDASAISFTSDGWTSTNGKCSFLSLTAHWLTGDFYQKTAILRVLPLNESHTAQNISKAIQSCMDDFNIPASKVHLIARDNAANMVAGIREANYESLPCFLHTLQLALNDAVFAQKYVKNMAITCKNLITHFNHSPSSYEDYHKYQIQYEVPENRFIQDISTRWNSQYFMFERILEQKRALIPFLCDNPKIKSLENSEWQILEKLVHFLKMFTDVTNLLSEREAIASSIIPTVQVIKNLIVQAEESQLFLGLGATISVIKKSSNERFEKYIDDKNLILATFLDPRYKDKFFHNEKFEEDLKEKIIRWLVEHTQHMQTFDDNGPIESLSSEPEASTSSGAESFKFDFYACFDNIVKKTKVLSEKTTTSKTKHYFEVKNEVSIYLSQEIIRKQECPLAWWRSMKSNFECLAPLAQKYLSCPPSSVESERLFSCGGQIYSPRRNKLAPDTGEMLMFLHYNLRILNFKY